MRFIIIVSAVFLATFLIASQILSGPSMKISASELKPDPRLPTFADARRSLSDDSFQLPAPPASPAIKRDPEIERLRNKAERAIASFQTSPCNAQARENVVKAITEYAKPFRDRLDCRSLWFCSNEKINKAAFSNTTPEDFDLWIELLKMSEAGGITAKDFPSSLNFPIKLWVKDGKRSNALCSAATKS